MCIRDRTTYATLGVVVTCSKNASAPDLSLIHIYKHPNTGLVVKKIQNDEKSSLLALKIITSDDNKDYKNSVITSWKITEKRLNNYLRNKDVIYKKA